MEFPLKRILYTISCCIGALLIIFAFIVSLVPIKMPFRFLISSFGCLILSLTFLSNYFFSTSEERRIKYWWQNICGYLFFSFFVLDFIPIKLPLLNLILIVIAIIFLRLEYKRVGGKGSFI